MTINAEVWLHGFKAIFASHGPFRKLTEYIFWKIVGQHVPVMLVANQYLPISCLESSD